MRIVAVDTGTTNTRAWVVGDGEVEAVAQGRGGARDVARGMERRWLAERVRDLAARALDAASVAWGDIEAIVAFGMVTSEFGLEEVAHLPVPVGPSDLANGLRRHVSEIELPAPVLLVPGVVSRSADLARSDFIRGEETHIVGLLAAGIAVPPLLFVSAGSHTKFVNVDSNGAVTASFTTLSGELLWALSRETILAPLLDLGLPLSDPMAADQASVLAKEDGLSRALYAVRVVNRLDGATPERCTDMARGAVAAADLQGLRSFGPLPKTVVVVAGGPLGSFYTRLLEREPGVERVLLSDAPLGALGAWDLYIRSKENVPT